MVLSVNFDRLKRKQRQLIELENIMLHETDENNTTTIICKAL